MNVGRHRSRQAALQALYAADLAPDEASPEEVFEGVADHFELPGGARDFAWKLVEGVASQRRALDGLLDQVSSNWRIDRMAVVDRNVLRMAAYELLHLGTPREVVIDEAVELARRFSGDRSPAFVNGVLDALARREGSPDPSPSDPTEPEA
ncbi:MAG: transcription antitermination factor NusB [Myxococcota bacterium]|nr:transcription antitermination factor NusB [Myxococcota bacterium]